jgi:hypothetical protein
MFRDGRLAQLVRAPALQAGGRRFEPCTAHQFSMSRLALQSAGNLLLANRASLLHFRAACGRWTGLLLI